MRVQLAPPWRVAVVPVTVRGTARARQAVRVRLHDGEGQSGLGEALPLPGYSRDDADTAQRLLAALFGVGLEVPDSTTGVACIAATLAPLEALLAPSPSARFALECALLDLLARRAGQSAAAWLAEGRALQPVPVSVLLPEDVTAASAVAEIVAFSTAFTSTEPVFASVVFFSLAVADDLTSFRTTIPPIATELESVMLTP